MHPAKPLIAGNQRLCRARAGLHRFTVFAEVQLLGTKRRVAKRPFNRFVLTLQALHQNPLTRPVLGRVAVRVLGLRPAVLDRLYSEAEAAHARRASFDQLAEEALAAKFVLA